MGMGSPSLMTATPGQKQRRHTTLIQSTARYKRYIQVSAGGHKQPSIQQIAVLCPHRDVWNKGTFVKLNRTSHCDNKGTEQHIKCPKIYTKKKGKTLRVALYKWPCLTYHYLVNLSEHRWLFHCSICCSSDVYFQVSAIFLDLW